MSEGEPTTAPVAGADIVHIVGLDVQVGSQHRQRCAWCGAVLIDYDLSRMAVPEGDPWPPPIWKPGELVAVGGGASWVFEHADGDSVPVECCARIDDAVTA